MCHLQELYAKYESKGLVILGFDAADDKQIALEMLLDNKATFPNIIDSSDAAIKVCFQQYQGRYGSAVPMNYIIDPEGKVMDAWYGGGREHPKAIAAIRKIGGPLAEAMRQESEKKKSLLESLRELLESKP
jgi:peroxiredoxin